MNVTIHLNRSDRFYDVAQWLREAGYVLVQRGPDIHAVRREEFEKSNVVPLHRPVGNPLRGPAA